ncbi:glycosyltransferase family 2 protein [Magnetospira sp. QH-2]|uniref:glycosyltransferase family 2 protein n=1 Tax=Magnetospira sp. (strain QH-2) TaxID=1288970 RepID=UPI0003E81BAF|nr:glycosyltransferase family 2 protein [Magnetospira sp. QH-2]CCQ72164.1 putative GT2 : related to UDP-Glc: bactoprenol glucosyltransferase [Magnetospira sp. QH-2]
MSDRKTISVVTPCYNEEEGIRACYEAVKAQFDENLPQYDREHIFCDNASTDRTLDILKEIADRDKSVKIIVNARNFGPMRSHFNGVKAATGDGVLLFMPADLQDPPELLPRFVEQWEAGWEVVYGVRANRIEGFPMKQIRKFYYRLIAGTTYLDMPPDVGDCQFVDKKVMDVIRQFDDHYPFVRCMTFEAGFTKTPLPYTVQERKAGISKNRFFHLIDQGLNGLISFSSTPMRLALYLGMTLATLSILFAFVNVILTLVLSQDVPRGMPLMITALFFFSGVQLFFIGFLGEYILSIHGYVKNRPTVIERERINFDKDDSQ